MNTRFNKVYYNGYYRKLHNGETKIEKAQRNNTKTRLFSKIPLREIKKFCKRLEYIIINLLKVKRRENCFKRGRILINSNLSNFFMNNLAISKKFEINNRFFSIYRVQFKRRFQNKTLTRVKFNSFKVKIRKERQVTYLNGKNVLKKIDGGYFFIFKFIKEEKVLKK